ncbi:MAG TPA: site-specific integrase, partial [Segeticoccus sp.]|uniref:site-specific integrase n=1 Tax=Segeticoccus sp. TaxID=2706531 RepID=UPI002D7E737D
GLRPAVLLGAFAGLRVAEAAALRAGDVDLAGGVIIPTRQWPDLPLNSRDSSTPIPIPRDLAQMLAAALQAGSGQTFVTDQLRRPAGPWLIERHVRRARVKVPGLSERFRFHDLRHYFASLLIASGLDVKVVQTRLRHASAMTTLNTYGHLWPDTDQASRAAVSAALRVQDEEFEPSSSHRSARS